jgi:hypothetical protein
VYDFLQGWLSPQGFRQAIYNAVSTFVLIALYSLTQVLAIRGCSKEREEGRTTMRENMRFSITALATTVWAVGTNVVAAGLAG